MKKITNPTAGMGNPMWYEWLVGLLYALDMLNPDNNIKSVTLQASKLQGLDDVVVNYNDGLAKCIQVKHTREQDSLTFSDLIRNDKQKNNSYIYKFSTDWLNALSIYGECRAILFTNRSIGKQKYDVKKEDIEGYERPPLYKFWPYIKEKIKDASSLKDVVVKEEWEEAWKEILNEMSSLDDDQKLLFLKNFDIQTDQEDLNEIKDSVGKKLSEYFKVGPIITTQLYQKLSYALMQWTTTLRKSEEITKEDLLEALSLASDNYKGIHFIPTNEPFFKSRIEFVNNLEEKLSNREYPMVFLYGNPGTGKTNIVSHLTNKVNSVITLRFYAFKPLTSNDLYLSADKGVSDPRALWGDLLIQLRKLLKGKIAKYKVPVSNELLSTVDELRDEVIRLSVALAKETNKTTVIAIDGIDHAARSGKDNTFLQTLIPPEAIPKEICFLIAGQPTYDYHSYPTWLKEDDVLSIEVPQLDEDDILELFKQSKSNIPSNDLKMAARIVNNHAHGNTLSVIFAVQEAKKCETLEQIEKRLSEVKLSSGISSYYEYIWKSALENIPSNFFYVDMLLAGVLSLINKRISPKMIDDIYGDNSINVYAWNRILQKMYPIVIEEKEGYRVFHNDVRIYLSKYLKSNISSFIEVASKIANYYLLKSDDVVSKHELIFKLLDYADRGSDYINIFTTDYVMEAIEVGRPIHELMEQLDLTLKSLKYIDDLKELRELTCAVATLYQFFQSMQWADIQYKPVVPVQDILESEKRVVPKSLLTIDDLKGMLDDVNLLVEYDEIDRGKNILINWLGEIELEDLLDILVENNSLDEVKLDSNLSYELEELFKTMGELYQYTGFNSKAPNIEELSKRYKLARAFFTKGWLDKGRLLLDKDSIERTIKNIYVYFPDDLQSYIIALMDSNIVDIVIKLTHKYEELKFTNPFKTRLATWSIINGVEKHYEDLISDIISKEFNYIDDIYNLNTFNDFVFIAFILSYSGMNPDKILELFFSTYRDGKSKAGERDHLAAFCLILVSMYLGFMYRCIIKGNAGEDLKIEDYERYVYILLDERNIFGRYEINSIEIEKYLLKQYIDIAKKIDGRYIDAIYKIIVEKAENNEPIRYIDIYWEFLKDKRETRVLEDIFDYWMSEEGIVWNEDIGSLMDISEDFINKAYNMGWDEKAKKAKEILNHKYIGYIGRKEYSLYIPLKWYEKLDGYVDNVWKDYGITLLNISENASKLGENSAAASIDSAIAESAGREGYEALWEFANLTNNWDSNWINTIFDGVISSLETHNFSEEELINIWKISTKKFYIRDIGDRYDINQKLGRIYIIDIKEAIILAADRLGYLDISDKMKAIDDYAFELERLSKEDYGYSISKRWFEDSTSDNKFVNDFTYRISQLSVEESYECLLEEFNSRRDSFRWDFIVEFINKIKAERKSEINNYLDKMLKLLLSREISDYWQYDGINRAYEAIIPYLEAEEIKVILNDILSRYFSIKESDYERRIFQLNNDLEDFAYCYYDTLPQTESIEVLNLILDMHEKWLTGNGILPMKIYYKLEDEIELPTSWMDFLDKFQRRIFY